MQGRFVSKLSHKPFACGIAHATLDIDLGRAHEKLHGMMIIDDVNYCSVHDCGKGLYRIIPGVLGDNILPNKCFCRMCTRLYGMRLVRMILNYHHTDPSLLWAMQCIECKRVICERHWYGCNESLLCRQCCLKAIRNTGITPAIRPLLLPEWCLVIGALRDVYIYHRIKKTRWGQLDRDIWKQIAMYVITSHQDLPKKTLMYDRKVYFN